MGAPPQSQSNEEEIKKEIIRNVWKMLDAYLKHDAYNDKIELLLKTVILILVREIPEYRCAIYERGAYDSELYRMCEEIIDDKRKTDEE